MNDADRKIRAAVHELVAAAPAPQALREQQVTGSYRWIAIAAAAVLIISGVVAIAAWQSTRDDSASISKITETAPTLVIDTRPDTAPDTAPDSSQTSESLPPTTTSTDQTVVSHTEFPIPHGSFVLGTTDLIATLDNGDLVLLADAFGTHPGDPFLLVDMPDQGALSTIGEPNTVDRVAGVIDGTVVYGTCCEPVAGTLLGLTAAGDSPTLLGYGSAPTLSPDGQRIATVGGDISVIDTVAGTRTTRPLDQPGDPDGAFEVAWSPDGSTLVTLTFAASGWTITRFDTERSFSVIDQRPVDTAWQQSPAQVSLIGTASDGSVGVAITTSEETRIQWLDWNLQAVAVGHEPLPVGARSVRLSPDGETLLWVIDGTLYTRSDGEPVAIANGIESAWFVPSQNSRVQVDSREEVDSPELQSLRTYFAALANGQYEDAARLLQGGGLENESRADLRPLYREYGDLTDFADRLRAWCENEAICVTPTDIRLVGTWYIADFPSDDGEVTGYFRSSFYEAVADVHGLPPRRPISGDVVPCPTTDIELVREADLDGDGAPETIIGTADRTGTYTLIACGTSLEMEPLAIGTDGGNSVIAVIDEGSNAHDELLIGTAYDTTSVELYRLGGTQLESSGTDYNVVYLPNSPGWTTSFGCEDLEGEPTLVGYGAQFVGGVSFDDSSAVVVGITTNPGRGATETRNFELPAQLEEVLRFGDPHCDGLPIFTF